MSTIHRGLTLVALPAALLVIAGTAARAQDQKPPAGQPGQPAQAPRRRALEIRGQAPAPEIVTVRPREIPAYTRKLLVPALFADSVGGPLTPARPRTTIILLPAPLPDARPAGSPPPVPHQ